MRSLFLFCFILFLLTGCAAHHAQTLGVVHPGVVTVIHDLKSSKAPIMVQGTMIEKCPISGCWFKLRDKSGVIKVDTKNAGFVVADVPLNTDVTVSGTFQTEPERQVTATGVRY